MARGGAARGVRAWGASAVAGAVAQHVEARAIPQELEGVGGGELADVRERVGLVSEALVGGRHDHGGGGDWGLCAGAGGGCAREVVAAIRAELAVIEGALGIGGVERAG